MISVFDLTGASGAALRTLTEKSLSWSPLYEETFGKFMAPNFVQSVKGESRPTGGMKMPSFTNAPIETKEAFRTEGGTEMLIPVMRPLSTPGVFGNTPAFGLGERDMLAFRRVVVNRTIKPYAPPQGMEYQKTKKWAKQFIKDARSRLRQHYSGMTGFNIRSAFLTGYSSDLNQGSNIGGAGELYASHPSFYVAGTYGQVGVDTNGNYTSQPYTAAYEALIQAAVDGLTGAAGQQITGDYIGYLVLQAQQKRIQRIVMKDGFYFYPIFVKDSVYFDLWRDPQFRDIAKRVDNTTLAKTPFGNCEGAAYLGAVIYPDIKMPCIYTASNNGGDTGIAANVVEYGVRPSTALRGQGWQSDPNLLKVDSGQVAAGILVGASALTIGTGEDLKIIEQEEELNSKYEMAYDIIQSIVRCDVIDTIGSVTGTKGGFVENTSSIAFAAWAKKIS